MTDMNKTADLLNKYNIDFYTTLLYNDNNEKCGWAMWLEKGGHIEFDLNQKLTNVVNY